MALVLGVLGTVAAVQNPRPSEAAPTLSGASRHQDLNPSSRDASSRGAIETDEALGPFVGELISSDFRILVYAGVDGPRYTVLNADGTVLSRGLHADEVYRTVPGLDVRDLQSVSEGSPNSPIMLAPEPGGAW